MAPKEKKIKSQLSEKSGEKFKLSIYYLFVVGFALVYHLISNQAWFLNAAQPIYNSYAQLSSAILNVLGQETSAIGEQISSTVCNLKIKEGCDGITPMILYSMSIIAFPVQLRFKWKGILIGLLGLFVLNLIRIISLYFIGKYGSDAFFDFMHIDVWSTLFLVITLVFWLIWMRSAFVTKSAHLNK